MSTEGGIKMCVFKIQTKEGCILETSEGGTIGIATMTAFSGWLLDGLQKSCNNHSNEELTKFWSTFGLETKVWCRKEQGYSWVCHGEEGIFADIVVHAYDMLMAHFKLEYPDGKIPSIGLGLLGSYRAFMDVF
jgi:hypothetical protein